jgi:hypothetical protein
MLNMHEELEDQASWWKWMWWFLTNHTINPHTTSEGTQTTQTSGSKPKRHEIDYWFHMIQISNPENPEGHGTKDMIGMTSAEWHELRICMSQVLPSLRWSVGWKHAGWIWLMSSNGTGAFFAGWHILTCQGFPEKAHRGNHIVCPHIRQLPLGLILLATNIGIHFWISLITPW